jgi:hypothetical protein
MTRSAENRLSGTVGASGGASARAFAGTLELIRMLEALVPVEGHAAEPYPTGPQDDISANRGCD